MGPFLQTTASVLQRTLTVRHANGVDERYALFRFARGEVYWRLDEFRPSEGFSERRWVACRGRLSVAQVIGRLPGQARTIAEWTRQEIALGTVVANDVSSATTRKEALDRLQAELHAALGVGSQTV